MNDAIKAIIKRKAEELASDLRKEAGVPQAPGKLRRDAIDLVGLFVEYIIAETDLDYPKGSEGYGVLHKACYDAIWDATK